MSQKLTILFDLDGTLVNTAPDLMRAHNFVMKKYGYEKDRGGRWCKEILKNDPTLKSFGSDDNIVNDQNAAEEYVELIKLLHYI